MIFFKNTVCESDDRVIIFEAVDSDVILGSCTLVLDKKIAEVTKLEFDKDFMFIAEGLLKSAFNYAAIKNYYMAKCSVRGIDTFLERMNFQKNDEEYTNDIPTILMGSCKHCGN